MRQHLIMAVAITFIVLGLAGLLWLWMGGPALD